MKEYNKKPELTAKCIHLRCQERFVVFGGHLWHQKSFVQCELYSLLFLLLLECRNLLYLQTKYTLYLSKKKITLWAWFSLKIIEIKKKKKKYIVIYNLFIFCKNFFIVIDGNVSCFARLFVETSLVSPRKSLLYPENNILI